MICMSGEFIYGLWKFATQTYIYYAQVTEQQYAGERKAAMIFQCLSGRSYSLDREITSQRHDTG